MRIALFICCLLLFIDIQAQETLLLRSPSVSDTKICFSYGGDIWVAGKDGSHPVRLTVNQDAEENPVLSPDGKWIAFSGNYDGNMDVYVLPVTGGDPKRLTYHPSGDVVRGWDGNNKIIFMSSRESVHPRYAKLFGVDRTTGAEAALVLPEASQGNFWPMANTWLMCEAWI